MLESVEAGSTRVAVFGYPVDLIKDCFDVRGGPLEQIEGGNLAGACGGNAMAEGDLFDAMVDGHLGLT